MKPKYMRADFPMMRFNRTAFERRVIYPIDDTMTEALGYLLGWCLKKHDLLLYAFICFFNHHHAALGHPLGDDSPEVKARFADFWTEYHWWVHRLLFFSGWSYGRAMNPLERTWDAPTLDAERILDDLAYIMGQAVKAGIFPHTDDYPGLCFLPEDVLAPRVFERNSLIGKLDKDGVIFTEETIEVQLSIPKPFRHLEPETYVEVLRGRLTAYEDEVRPEWASKLRGRRLCRKARLGTKFKKHLDKLKTRGKRPQKPPQGPRDPYTSDPALKRAYLKERRQFWDEHYQSWSEVKAGRRNVRFPAGTYGARNKLECGVLPSEPPCWAGQEEWTPH